MGIIAGFARGCWRVRSGSLGVGVLETLGVVDVAESIYLTPNIGCLANIVGGLMFDFGMVFAGGWISRNLVRAGGGDLQSLVVLMLTGIFGFMTIGGLLGALRGALFGPATLDLTGLGLDTQGVDELQSAASGLGTGASTAVTLLAIAGAILFYCFKDPGLRSSPNHLTAGTGIGLVVVEGWLLTGLAQGDFADVPVQLTLLTYVRPSGDALDYLMRFTAIGPLIFGVVTLAGALLGRFVGALSRGRLHLTTFADKKRMTCNMFDASFMGVGGVLALGCAVGQGLTGVSTLAVRSFITMICIICGCAAGVKSLEWLVLRD